jgi:hypothetical protein
VRELHPELIGPGSPPAPFADRYRIYYQHAPYDFPEALTTSPISTQVGALAVEPRPAVGSASERA